MATLIDWLSISLPLNGFSIKIGGEGRVSLEGSVHDVYPHITEWINGANDLSFGNGRRPFTKSIHSQISGFTCYWSETLPYFLVEFTGTGCAELRKYKVLGKILRLYRDHITRMDIATDIECDVQPIAFAEMRDTKRFKSFSIAKSESGETYYVGSKTSDRYVRVYRYFAPHPRSHLLRVEVVLRDDNARAVAHQLGKVKLSQVAQELGKTFGWQHPIWKSDANVEPSKAAPRDTKQGKTERWLIKAVLPAIKRMLDNGSRSHVLYFLEQVHALLNNQSTGGSI